MSRALSVLLSLPSRLVALLAALLMVFSPAKAGDSDQSTTTLRPVLSVFSVEAGASQLADTYLTPLVYHGYHLGFDYQRMQAAKFSPERWIMRLDVALRFDHADNPSGNASMLYGHVEASWGMIRRWEVRPSLTLGVGGATGIDLGCFYNGRNSNNPASAKAAWTLNLTGLASWRTRLWRLPVTLTYQPTLPMVGAFFSPEYDELYYEISLGNRRNLAHFAWPGRYFRLDNLLCADMHFGSTSIRVGFRSDVLSTKVNGIVTRCFTNSFVLGVTSNWLGYSSHLRLADDTRAILAIY